MVLKLEQVADKLPNALGNHDAVRLGDALQARRQISVSPTIACSCEASRADQVTNDHQTRGDADTCLKDCLRLQVAYALAPCSNGGGWSDFHQRQELQKGHVTDVSQ
jgi:hypothetical protein